MNPAAKITRFVGLAIICLTISLSAAGFYIVRTDIETMRTSGKENILWHAVQLELELKRFQLALKDFSEVPSSDAAKEVNNRFDILWSRILLFERASVGDRLSAYETSPSEIDRLFDLMKDQEGVIVGLSPESAAKVTEVGAMFTPFTSDLRQFSRRVLHGEEQVAAGLREDLSQSSFILSLLSTASVIVSVLLVLFFARESRRFQALATQNASLLMAAEKASKAKTQFLTMMSHELRTPMNGVMGPLALIKQNGLSAVQVRLVEQMERSGRQMNGLLSDILDFAALQDAKLKLDSKPFDPRQLLESIRERFEDVAAREGAVFDAHVSQDCPDLVIGDFRRLRQALTHLSAYLLETAGTRKLCLELSYDEGMLQAAISFEYHLDGGDWEPELIIGNIERARENFASDALGPAVARALIEQMGGITRLHNPQGDQISVLVSVPAEVLVLERLVIRVASRSAALEAICKAALRSDNVAFWSAETDVTPHVVMIEAGGPQETENVKKFGEAYPSAMLVALGRPQNPEDFDDVIDVPINVAAVHQATFMRLAG